MLKKPGRTLMHSTKLHGVQGVRCLLFMEVADAAAGHQAGNQCPSQLNLADNECTKLGLI